MKKHKRQNKYLDVISKKYASQDDNIFPKSMSDSEFRHTISNYLLGKKWYNPNPVSQGQMNVYLASAIIEKFNVKGKRK